ncbi:hypothetical protein PT276_10335 [Orbaceae bacterium ESL0721]|nr:hypothetical protein [Orbaceae bacterium ESL0721]
MSISTVTTLPQKAGEVKQLGQLVGSSLSLVCAQIINAHNGLVVHCHRRYAADDPHT